MKTINDYLKWGECGEYAFLNRIEDEEAIRIIKSLNGKIVDSREFGESYVLHTNYHARIYIKKEHIKYVNVNKRG